MSGPGERVVLRRLGRGRGRDYQRHLQRLDRGDRFRRFHAVQPDAAIAAHCGALDLARIIVIGAFARGELRGAIEVHPPAAPGAFAELAVSVERPYQGTGLGRALFRRALQEAGRRGIGRVRVSIFTDDARMRHIAEQSGLEVDWDERDGVSDDTGDDTIAGSGLDGVC